MLHHHPPTVVPEAMATALADKVHRQWAFRVCLTISLFTLVLLPWASTPLVPLPNIIPFYTALVVCTDAITAYIIFGQFRQDRTGSLPVLGAAYLFTGGMSMAHLLTFPLVTGEMWGGVHTSPWLWILWHLGFPLACLLFLAVEARYRRSGKRVPPGRTTMMIACAVIATMLLVIGCASMAIYGHDYLPAIIEPNGWTIYNKIFVVTSMILTTATLAIHCWITRCRSFLHLWLAVALVAFLCDITPNFLSDARYTVGWYLGRLNGMVAASFLMLMFLTETIRLYQRLGVLSEGLAIANHSLEHQVIELQVTNRQLHQTVAEKNLLLREVYHRVKNNLQVVDSLLVLHTADLPDEAHGRIMDLRKRVNALGLVHQQLMQSSDLATLDLSRFLADLCDTLATSMDAERRGIKLRATADRMILDLDLAIPLGLIVTELVSNAFKHAFPTGHKGQVFVKVKCQGETNGCLMVCDTGQGMPEHQTGTSVGHLIIEALLGQLDATMTIKSNPKGTAVAVRFPLPKRCRQ